jgi:energy-coupling factor transport system ATP-binding protein
MKKMARTEPFRIRGVTVQAEDGRELLAVDRLEIAPGEWVHVVGPNGSGKSTLAKLIAGLLPEAAGGGTAVCGTISRGFAGDRPLPWVAQDPETAVAGTTPWEDLALALEARGIGGEEALREIESLLRLCRLWERRFTPVERLSGGQKQLLAAAGCLASGAPLLVFDEAVSMLDAAGRALVLEGARRMEAAGAAVVWITHSAEDIARGDRIVGLRDGRIVFDGPAEAFFRAEDGEPSPCERIGCGVPHAVRTALALRRLGLRLEPLPLKPEELARALAAHGGLPDEAVRFLEEIAEQTADEGASPSGGCDAGPEAGRTSAAGTGIAAGPVSGTGGGSAARGGTGAGGPSGSGAAEDWRIDGLTVRLDGGAEALRDVSAVFRAGRITAIVGPNGAGKTTLLETMAGLRRPSGGAVTLGGVPVWSGRRPRRDRLLRFGFAMQRSESAWFHDTARSELFASMRPYGVPGGNRTERAKAALAQAGLDEGALDRAPWTLSGGEQRRLSRACLAAAGAPWLLLDEPTAGLDAAGTAALRAWLAAHRAAGGGAVVATHDLDALWPVVDDVVVLAGGTIREAAPAAAWARAVLAGGSVMPPEALPQALRTAAAFRAAGIPRREAAAPAAEAAASAARSHGPEPDAAASAPAPAPPPPSAGPGKPDAAPCRRLAERDPRALWAAYLLAAAGVLATDGPADTAAALAASAALVLPVRRLLRPYRGVIVWYLAFTAALALVSGATASSAVAWHPDAARDTALAMLRLLAVMLLGMPLPALIPPYRLRQAVERLLSAVRLPARTVRSTGLAVSLLFRFIPLMAAEWGRFARIAVARGKHPAPPGRVPLRALPAALVPFLLAMLQAADRVAVSLTLRGFGGGQPAARVLPIRFTRLDAAFVAGAAAFFALLMLVDAAV